MDAAAIRRQLADARDTLTHAWVAGIRAVRAANPVEHIALRLHSDPVGGLDHLATRTAAGELAVYLAAGRGAAREASAQLREHDRISVRKKTITFEAEDPDVMSWAERSRLDLIQGLSFEQRVMIRYELSVAQETGENPRVTATRIRDSIGLTSQQAQAVERYRAQLEAGQYAAALERQLASGHSDRAIRSARQRDVELTPQQIDLAVERYRTNMLAYRAEVIARTEAARVVNQGVDAMYRQALRRGDLDAEQIECGWIATDDPRTRDTHAAMHGQIRAWGELFQSPSGALLLFPGDPSAPAKETANCRCARTVRIRAARVAVSVPAMFGSAA